MAMGQVKLAIVDMTQTRKSDIVLDVLHSLSRSRSCHHLFRQSTSEAGYLVAIGRQISEKDLECDERVKQTSPWPTIHPGKLSPGHSESRLFGIWSY